MLESVGLKRIPRDVTPTINDLARQIADDIVDDA